HRQCGGDAGRDRRRQQFVWGRALVAAAEPLGFVGDDGVTSVDVDLAAQTAAGQPGSRSHAHVISTDEVRRTRSFTSPLYAHAWVRRTSQLAPVRPRRI